jgi:hypothetical protein
MVSGWCNACVYAFRMIPTMNSRFPVHHSAAFCSNGEGCFLCAISIGSLLWIYFSQRLKGTTFYGMAHGTLISVIGGYRLTLLQQVGCVTR